MGGLNASPAKLFFFLLAEGDNVAGHLDDIVVG